MMVGTFSDWALSPIGFGQSLMRWTLLIPLIAHDTPENL
jgi:hypothetical protein